MRRHSQRACPPRRSAALSATFTVAALLAGSTSPASAVPSRTVVGTAAGLQRALDTARPGSVVELRDGVYRGRFTIRRSGTAAHPILVTGGRGAVLDAGTPTAGYALHLDGADHVQVRGLTVRGGKKGVVLDTCRYDTLRGLDVSRSGEELVLLRNLSSDNRVLANDIHHSGLVHPGYGEGIYVGLAASNWASRQSRTHGAPDRSDRNVLAGNTIHDTTAESIDLKEGSSGGTVTGNTFNSRGMSGANFADSWLDVQGNGYRIIGNRGTNPGSSLRDGYQTHVILPGWGRSNVFRANLSTVNAAGYGINIQTTGPGNVVAPDNTAAGARHGLTNTR